MELKLKCKICGDETENSDGVCDSCKAIMINMNMKMDGFKL